MKNLKDTRKGSERAISKLEGLYESYGYSKYKMSKFEEYELYVRNKSFLASSHIITFTDTNGSLMALKPDVTLSIVKNSPEREEGVRRVYYNENVYRVPKGAISYKEIMQAGLECIGDIDDYCVFEVLSLACDSLANISSDYVLDVSHMGMISSLIGELGLSSSDSAKLLDAVGEKNLHEIDRLCLGAGADASVLDTLKSLVSFKGNACDMPKIVEGKECYRDALSLAKIVSELNAAGKKVNVDFSVTDDLSYYSGIVFKGFIKGIPTSVLSGGRYDNLMKKMGKASGAIGFAVYLDLISELDCQDAEYDVDTVVLYGSESELSELNALAAREREEGNSVFVTKKLDEKKSFKKLINITGGQQNGNA